MATEQLMIVQKELELLKKHLRQSSLSDYNKQKLLDELDSAKVMHEDQLPEDAVCIDSEVEIEEVTSGQKFTFQIVFPSEANMKQHRISVFAPIGIALLGYRVGSRVQWEMPNGVKAFTILKVIQKKRGNAFAAG